MAQKVQIVLEDDIDGGVAAETVVFGLDGITYEIDLNDKNAAQLRDALAPWVASARRSARGAGRAAGGRRRSTAARTTGGTSDVRAWLKENGYTVSDRGRIPAELQAKYDAAH